MPQKTFLKPQESNEMGVFLKTIIVILIAVGSFALGWFTSNKGYRIVDSNGSGLVQSNAAQIVKDENARLGREVVNKNESEAEELLRKNNRTMFVGTRDGQTQEYKGQKTFTNLTVEVKEGKVVKVLGWY